MNTDHFKQRFNDRFKLVKGDIFDVEADVLAFSASPMGIGYDGCIDWEINKRADREKLHHERQEEMGNMGRRCRTGDILVTGGCDMPYKWLFHIYAPLYTGRRQTDEDKLYDCYTKCIRKANGLGAKSIAFPLLGTGDYGYDIYFAYDVARAAINSAMHFERSGLEVFLVINDDELDEDTDQFDPFTREFIRQAMAHMSPEDSKEKYMASMMRQCEELKVQYDRAKSEGDKEREKIKIYNEIKAEKKKFFAKDPDKTDEDFALQKLADVVNGWINLPNDEYTGAKYERKERSATRLARLIGVSPSTVTTLTNMTKGLPERDTVVALAIAMKLPKYERTKFIMYRDEEVKYPSTRKEEKIEEIIENHGHMPEFIDLNAELYNTFGETVIKQSERTAK